MIGFLSQLGYVVAYAVSGTAADLIGKISGCGVGKGAATVIMIAGICMAVTALMIMLPKSINELENT